MTLEQYRKWILLQDEQLARMAPQRPLVEEMAAEIEDDVGEVRLLRLQAAMKGRRGPGTEG
jgi:hypothetical protein